MNIQLFKNKLFNFDPLLVKCSRFAPKGKVIDFGLGETGRNALFFSALGYDVCGIDIDESAVRKSIERAKSLNLNIDAFVGDISKIEIKEKEYSIAMGTYMWQYFSREEAERIVRKMKRSLLIGGIVYIAEFTANDICFDRVKKDSDFKLIGPNVYYAEKENWWKCKNSSKGTYVHCFSKEDVLSLFGDFEQIYFSEAVYMDIDHSDPHYHNNLIYIGRKIK